MTLASGMTLFDRYRIVRLLGQGGFGAVYRAWDITLERPCAIKESLETSLEAQRQFKREAKLLANLAHPNLPRVTDYFTVPGQGQYLVMDFVEGEDLQELLSRSQAPLPESRILPYILQVCDALVYLHGQDPPVIHRDIKPANIKITPQGKAMLVDFGIAKQYSPGSQTTEGARAVTPGFSPYEQYGVGSTDTRSDIYALGATLYILLTGIQPPESLQRVLNDQMAPVGQANPHTTPHVQVAVNRALQLDPNSRFQTATDLKLALQGQDTSARLKPHPVSEVVSGRRESKHAIPVVPLLVLLLLGIGTLVGIILLVSSSGSISGLINQSIGFLAASVPTSTSLENAQPTGTTPDLPASTEISGPASAVPTLPLAFQAGATSASPVDGATLVYIPAGEFWMGSTEVEAGPKVDQLPRHRVYLEAYWIDRLEVTNGLYGRCVEAGACQAPVRTASTTRESYFGNPDYAGYPVIWISYNDAANYCRWAGRRLPSEAEWERAARGDQGTSLYPWGSREPDGELANFCDTNCSFEWRAPSIDDSFADTAPVDLFSAGASPYGLLNLAGNVWEWVLDYYSPDYYSNSPFENPTGPLSGVERVLRGGSFENSAIDIRSTNRYFFAGDAATSSFGFRCAVSAQQEGSNP